MIQQPVHVEDRRPPLRGICLVVKDNQPARRPKSAASVGMTNKFPRRPDSGVLSESISLFLSRATEQGFG
jgi:hypothetical protein